MGDAINGKKIFMKLCIKCHTTEKGGKHKIGPNLHDIMGKTCGTMAGYKFSDPMKKKAIVWDEKTMNDFLESPKKFVPRTSMVFYGLKNGQERRDMIAFLATLK